MKGFSLHCLSTKFDMQLERPEQQTVGSNGKSFEQDLSFLLPLQIISIKA